VEAGRPPVDRADEGVPAASDHGESQFLVSHMGLLQASDGNRLMLVLMGMRKPAGRFRRASA
jgi:hypothetical protein